MSRSVWKGFFLSPSVLKTNKLKIPKIMSRSSTIPDGFQAKKVAVHNGLEFKAVYLVKEKIGFAFGEFSFTRKNTKKNLKFKSKKKLKK